MYQRGKARPKKKKKLIPSTSSMVPKDNKRAALHEKLQILRSVTNSHALNQTSIIVDATRYIEELKQKVERLNHDIAQTSSHHNRLPMVTVETLEKGFLISVYLDRNCPGLLVVVLEVFEELGLTVLEARVSCTETFQLQAVGGENEEEGDAVDEEEVKQAVLQAIKNWSDGSEQ